VKLEKFAVIRQATRARRPLWRGNWEANPSPVADGQV
jgi:hypothetical protein